MPQTLKAFGVSNLPPILDETTEGQIFWASIFTYLCALPLSIPRQLNSLRFASLASFLISVFVIGTIFAMSFYETEADSKPDKPRFNFP